MELEIAADVSECGQHALERDGARKRRRLGPYHSVATSSRPCPPVGPTYSEGAKSPTRRAQDTPTPQLPFAPGPYNSHNFPYLSGGGDTIPHSVGEVSATTTSFPYLSLGESAHACTIPLSTGSSSPYNHHHPYIPTNLALHSRALTNQLSCTSCDVFAASSEYDLPPYHPFEASSLASHRSTVQSRGFTAVGFGPSVTETNATTNGLVRNTLLPQTYPFLHARFFGPPGGYVSEESEGREYVIPNDCLAPQGSVVPEIRHRKEFP